MQLLAFLTISLFSLKGNLLKVISNIKMSEEVAMGILPSNNDNSCFNFAPIAHQGTYAEYILRYQCVSSYL